LDVGFAKFKQKGDIIMYLCIVYVRGEPQEGEPDYVSEVRYFNTIEEAKRFEQANWDYGIYIDIYKAERVHW
jgi:hypothetical protein